MFKTFHGEYNNKEIKIEETHESPLVMLIPLIFLSVGAIFAGITFKELFIGDEGIKILLEGLNIFFKTFKHRTSSIMVFNFNSNFSDYFYSNCILFVYKK